MKKGERAKNTRKTADYHLLSVKSKSKDNKIAPYTTENKHHIKYMRQNKCWQK